MVYCTRCGTLNPDSATNCSNCGAPLITDQNSRPYAPYEYRHHHRHDEEYRHHGGAGFGLLIAGIFIILIGLFAFTGFNVWAYIWPLFLILIGIWILTLGLRRTRRYH